MRRAVDWADWGVWTGTHTHSRFLFLWLLTLAGALGGRCAGSGAQGCVAGSGAWCGGAGVGRARESDRKGKEGRARTSRTEGKRGRACGDSDGAGSRKLVVLYENDAERSFSTSWQASSP